MNKSLGERFRESRGQPIQLDDKTVYGIYRRNISGKQPLEIRFRHTSEDPVQGLRMKLDKGSLVVNGQELKDVVLWADTSPETVSIECQPAGRGGELKIWNAWRDDTGAMQAWIGNAGIVVDEEGDVLTLRCSDGIGPPDFDDLIVEIKTGTQSDSR